MLEFLKSNFFFPLYAITLVISLVRYRLYYDSVLKYFPIILAYTLLSEVLGFFIKDFDIFQIIYSEPYDNSNYFIFNVYDVVFFLYFYFVFWKSLSNQSYKKIIILGAITYILSAIINPFFQNVMIFPQIYASTIGSLVLIIGIILYFKEIKTLKGKKNNLLIYIATGLLVFNVFFPPISIAGQFFTSVYVNLGLRKLHYVLIVLSYGCFIAGFIKMHRMKPLPDEN